MSEHIPRHNIAQPILDEMAQNFVTIDWSNYGGPISPKTVTRKLAYYDVEHPDMAIEVLDPATFTPKMIENPVVRTGYMVRCEIDGDILRPISVLTTGRMVTANRSNWEPKPRSHMLSL